ncbi:hypothetical protein DSO57_1008196 [Entomophthora muscae]|uniref:Uncharacterized protein n=1 Tax=Entomophthora muscae TaxID=34485 RepID=A0ACC2U5H0_9FUNG|nr:hypothetical protein DSO57_1008196 [Entomophthora muscae]
MRDVQVKIHQWIAVLPDSEEKEALKVNRRILPINTGKQRAINFFKDNPDTFDGAFRDPFYLFNPVLLHIKHQEF